MIKTSSIVYAVTKKINERYPGKKIFALVSTQEINEECFYIDVQALTRAKYKDGYNNKRMIITINYLKKDITRRIDYMDMQDILLDEIFTSKLEIEDRSPMIQNQTARIINDVLQCSFEIEFIDAYLDDSPVFELMEDLSLKIEG